MIRDRKMYVPRTVYALVSGLDRHLTLIVPADTPVDNRLQHVGQMERIEADALIESYSFDLSTSQLVVNTVPNPRTGTRHVFAAYRVAGARGPRVELIAAMQP